MNAILSPLVEGFVEGLRLGRDLALAPMMAVGKIWHEVAAAYVDHDVKRRDHVIEVVREIGEHQTKHKARTA